MNGRKTTLATAARITAFTLLILCALPDAASADQIVAGRRGQRGEGRAGGIVNFTELSAAERQSGGTEIGPRAVRPRSKPSSGRRPAVPGTFAAASETDPETMLFDVDSLFSPASGPVSPAPAASFPGLLDDATSFTPDTQGAVGTNHVVTMLASQVRIHDRRGSTISTVSLGTFWGSLGNSNVFDPRVLYDSFAHRWIATAIANPGGSTRALLIAVSQTSDPTGNWFRHSTPAGIGADVFIEGPSTGLTRDWITVQLNTFDNTNFFFFSSEIRAFNKARLYSGASAQFSFFRDLNAAYEGNAAVPAVVYDSNYATNFLVANWNGNADGFGYLRIYSISGPVGAEVFNDYGTNGLYVTGAPFGNPPWDDFSPETSLNFAPQQGTTSRIYIGDSRIHNVVFRNGTLWCAQHVFLPISSGAVVPTRCSVQWWALTTGGTVLQRGRIDDSSGGKFFAYPSIAVNQYEDVLIGYTRFGANQFPSANYSFRGFEDAFSTTRGDAVLKAGEAKFFVDDGAGFNRWGDWSATLVDPVNDTDLWTVQEYASVPVAGSDRWGTWWGQFGPPTSLSVVATDSPDPVVAGGNVTYSIRVTNNFPLLATGVRVVDTLPAASTFVSAVASQGACSHSNGVVTCNFGDVIDSGSVTATVVARLNQSGQAISTITTLGNGPDESPANNTVQVTTTVNPAADIAVLASGSPDPVTLNNTLTYSVVVTNLGPSSATGVSLTNTLPPGVTFLSATPSQGTCSQSSGIVRCTIGSLTTGSSVSVAIAVRPLASGMLTNRALVAASVLDPNPANNSTTVVIKANAAPTIQTISDRTINEDFVLGPITFTVSDPETPAASLTVAAFSSNQAIVPNGNISLAVVAGTGGTNRTITITPLPNANGVVTNILTATDQDGVSTTNTFRLTITAINDAPTITDIVSQTVNEDTVLGPITFTVGDIETAPGTLSVSTASLNTTLIPNSNIQLGPAGSAVRTVTITPATNQSGTATIQITVSDGTTTTSDTFAVTVNEVNDLPTISDIANRSINEDASTGTIPFTVGDIETGAGSLNPSGTSSNPTLVPSGSITFGGTGANRTVTVRPATNEFGTATITVSIADGNGSSTNDTFVLTVNPVNDPPTLATIPDLNINEDAGLQTVTLTSIGAGATNEVQTIEITASSDNTSLIPNPITINYTSPATTGTLSFTPVANSNGTAVVTVTVRDGGTSNNIITRTLNVNVAAVNDPPTIADLSDRTIDEDTSTGPIAVTIGDIDSPLASLSISATASDTNLVPIANILPGGTGANRTINITPAQDQSGSATITVFVTDGFGTSSDTFVLNVQPVNDAPIISAIPNRIINEDAATNISFTVSDVDTSATALNLSAVSSIPALFPGISFGGSGSDRTINLVPATDQTGSATLTVTVTDGDSGSNSVTFTVDVIAVDDPPTIARPDDLTITEDAPQQTVFLSGITSGAPNESQTLTVRAESSNPSLIPAPAVSYTSPNATGVLTFSPLPNASGSASISVSVGDGGATNTQSFTVTVLPVNDFPVLSEIGERQIDEDTTATINFYVNDAETPVDQLVIQVASSNLELLDETGIQLTGTGTNRTLLLTPLPDASESSTFITVNVTDGSNAMATTSFELIVLPVNDLPTLGGLTNRTVNESAVATALSLPFTVSDPESLPSTLTVTASSSNPALVANSGLSVVGSGTTRTLNLIVTAGQSGSAIITLVAKDGPSASAGSTTNSFVLRVNALPTLSAIGPRTMTGNTTSNFAFTVSDGETPASSVSVQATSSNQALVPDAGLTITGTGTDRILSVTPIFGQSGTVSISLAAQDADGGSTTNSFLLTVTRVDVPPVISNVANTNVSEDTTLVIPFTIGDAENPPAALTLQALSSNQTLLPLSGIVFGGSLSNRTVALTPAANRSGVVTVTLTVTDTNGGMASDDFVLTVNAINDLPTLSGLPNFTIDEDGATGPLSITVGDVETAAANLTLTAISSNTGLVPNANVVPGGLGADRTVTITPLANQTGSTLITLTLTDGDGASTNTTFTLTVAPVNDPPTLNAISDVTVAEDSGPRAVSLAGISAGVGEGQPLTFSVVSGNTNVIPSGSVNYTGGSSTAVLTFTPAADATGTALLTVQINDGGASNNIVTRSFLVTVTSLNDAPTISDISNQQTIEDIPLTIPFVINDRETSALSLVLTATSTNTALVANTNILINGSGTNRTLTVIPTSNASGTTLITVSVNDGATSATDTFVLTVTAANDPPTLDFINNTNVIAAGGNQSYTVNLTGITAGAANESQTLSISATAAPAMATAPAASISGSTGTVTLRPGNNVTGSWLITVTVSDGQASVVRTFTFSSRASGNTLPTISSIANQTINEDSLISALPFIVGDAETAAASLTVVAVSTNETLVPATNIVLGGSGANRTITVTPAPNRTGTTSIRMTVRDGANGSANMTFNVTVNAVNDPPTIQPISNLITIEDTPTNPIQVFVGDAESLPGALTVTATSANQTLVPNANILVGGSGTNRALILTPAANQSGSAVITVNVSDGSASANTQFTLTVNPVNDSPTISDVGDQTINEDTATVAIPFIIGDAETPASGLSLVFASENTSMAPLAFAFGGSGANRTLTITPAANLFGVTKVTLSVSDGTNQTSDTFLLTINPTNDTPTLDPISAQNVPLNAAGHTISLTGITSGAANENQTLIVAASSSNPSVIPHPRVNYTSPAATGSLTVSPVRGSTGSATITVTVNDGQPHSNGVTRAFTITILESGPALRIEHLGGMAVVSWPAENAEGWTLQSSANGLAAAGWSPVATVPVIVNSRYTVTNAPGSAMRVYRLCNGCGPGVDPTAPTLVISLAGTDLVISWPADAGNFVLEETAVLHPPIVWSTVTKPPTLANGQLSVTVDATSRKFYRLRNQ